jgi:hypothetical protein
MKTAILRAAAGAASLAAGLASAQVYSAYPSTTYGYAPNVVRCESINSRTNFCRADTRGGVQVYRQLSRQDCIRGRNWRATTDGIIVDDGCRADFAIASGYAGTQGYDRYGRPISVYDNRMGTDAYGRPIYDGRTSGYSNGGYAIDRYGNRVYVGNAGTYGNGGYTVDRYGNRVYVGGAGTYNGGYTTDRYGNRVYVDPYRNGSSGYYTTDRYGNRVWVQSSTYGGTTNDGYDDVHDTYYRNVQMGPPGGGSTYSTPTTYSADMAGMIHCQPAASGRTYCGDRTRTYVLHYDTGANCILNQTYGRDSNGTWVAGSCSMRMESSGQ